MQEESASCLWYDNIMHHYLGMCEELLLVLQQLKPAQKLDKLQEFTNSSNQIETDDVSASATILVASTRDVEGNKTVSRLYL